MQKRTTKKTVRTTKTLSIKRLHWLLLEFAKHAGEESVDGAAQFIRFVEMHRNGEV